MKTYKFGLPGWYLSIILFLGPLANSHAQSKVQIGPLWGQGIRMVTGNEEADIGFGYHGGIVARIPFDEKLSIVPSITVARKGYNMLEFGWWNEDNFLQTNQKLTYLDFYLPAKYQVAGIFNLQAGLQVGMLLDGELVIDSYDYGNKYKKNIKDELNPVDFGFIVGGGVQFKNGIGLDLIINQGLIRNYEEDPKPYLGLDNNYYYPLKELDGKNFLATISVYYLFGYVKKAAK